MVTKSDITTLVELLHGWQKLCLRKDHLRGMFFIWLSDHTKMEIYPETFQDKLTEWLLNMKDAKALYAEALTIHAEILWTSHKAKYETTFELIEKNP
jgi:hypothetical protein